MGVLLAVVGTYGWQTKTVEAGMVALQDGRGHVFDFTPGAIGTLAGVVEQVNGDKTRPAPEVWHVLEDGAQVDLAPGLYGVVTANDARAEVVHVPEGARATGPMVWGALPHDGLWSERAQALRVSYSRIRRRLVNMAVVLTPSVALVSWDFLAPYMGGDLGEHVFLVACLALPIACFPLAVPRPYRCARAWSAHAPDVRRVAQKGVEVEGLGSCVFVPTSGQVAL